MNLTIEFSNQFTRTQVQSNLNSLTLPTGATIMARTVARDSGISDVIDANTDLIDSITITDFTSWADVSAFVDSLPVASFNRISRLHLG